MFKAVALHAGLPVHPHSKYSSFSHETRSESTMCAVWKPLREGSKRRWALAANPLSFADPPCASPDVPASLACLLLVP